MPARVASLLIDVAADVAKVRKDFEGVSKTVQGFGSTIASIGKGLAAAFSVQQVLAYGAAIQASVDAMADMAENLKIPVEDFQALESAALLAGQSIESTSSALGKFNLFIGKAGEGSKEQVDRLNELGVKILDLNGNIRPTTDLLQEIASRITAIESPAKRAAAEVAFFGKSGQQVSAILEQWKRPLGEVNKELQDMGLVHSPAVVKTLADLADRADIGAKKLEVLFAPIYAFAKSTAIETVVAAFQNIANAINAVSSGSADSMLRVISALTLLATGNIGVGLAVFKGVGNPLQVLNQQIDATGKSIADLESNLEAYKRGGDKFAQLTLQTANDIAVAQLALSDLQKKRDDLTFKPVQVVAKRETGVANPAVKSTGVDKYAEALRKLKNDQEQLTAATDAYNKAATSGLPTAAAERLAKFYEDLAKKQNELGKGLTPAQADDIDKRVESLAKLQFAFDEVKRVQREGDAISRQYGDGQKEYAATVYALNEALAAQTITQAEYNNALAEANDKLALQVELSKKNVDGIAGLAAGFSYAMTQMGQQQSTFAMGQQLFTNSVNLMSSAISDFATTGEFNFQKIASSFAKMLADMAAQWAVAAALKAGLNALSGAFGGAAASPAGAFAGGTVGSQSVGFFDQLFGGGRAGGGSVTPGYYYTVGENGPEKFVPQVPGTIEAANSNSAPTGDVTVNIDMSGGQSAQDPAQAVEFGRRVKAAVVSVIENEKRPGGTLYARASR